MKLDEIISADEKLKLAQLIFNNTFSQLQSEIQQSFRPAPKPVAKPQMHKAKVGVPKKAPMASPPKPLPKSNPLPQTPTQIKHQQQKNQQDYANVLRKTLDQTNAPKVPRSLQPLPGNIISPIGGGDPELTKKLNQARQDGEAENRSSGSVPHFSRRSIS
jgi:hypothetical protein